MNFWPKEAAFLAHIERRYDKAEKFSGAKVFFPNALSHLMPVILSEGFSALVKNEPAAFSSSPSHFSLRLRLPGAEAIFHQNVLTSFKNKLSGCFYANVAAADAVGAELYARMARVIFPKLLRINGGYGMASLKGFVFASQSAVCGLNPDTTDG